MRRSTLFLGCFLIGTLANVASAGMLAWFLFARPIVPIAGDVNVDAVYSTVQVDSRRALDVRVLPR